MSDLKRLYKAVEELCEVVGIRPPHLKGGEGRILVRANKACQSLNADDFDPSQYFEAKWGGDYQGLHPDTIQVLLDYEVDIPNEILEVYEAGDHSVVEVLRDEPESKPEPEPESDESAAPSKRYGDVEQKPVKRGVGFSRHHAAIEIWREEGEPRIFERGDWTSKTNQRCIDAGMPGNPKQSMFAVMRTWQVLQALGKME